MKTFEITEIVNKLVGDINPTGDASRDDDRFENLKTMCELVNNLVGQIDSVAHIHRNSHEHSVKRAVDYASDFITNTLNIGL